MIPVKVRQIVPFIASVIIMASCSSSKNAVAVPERSGVKGTWVLNNITYEGLSSSQRLKITLLDEGSEACLTGSTWVLPNNGYGSYNITSSASGCTPGERNIIWSYQKNGDQAIFQYKRLEGGVKAKNITDGYKFRLVSVDETTMRLQSEVSFEGKPLYINYSFTKQ